MAGWKGPFRSTDGGLTWSPRKTGLPGYGATSLALAPGTPQAVYVAGSNGSFKSTDGGSTWQALGISSLSIRAVAVDPADPQAVYLATTASRTDAFVAELKASGTGLVFSTYLGGLETDGALGVAAGADGSAYVAGKTGYGFPVAGTLQTEPAGDVEAFVARLSGEGDECVLDCTTNVPAEARLGDLVDLHATTVPTACSGTATVEWDFGDGTSGTGASVVHSFDQPGTYTWRMSATIAGDTCTLSGTITIYTCEISCGATVAAAGLPGEPLPFAGSAAAPRCDSTPAIRWAFGDGSPVSTAASPSHAYESAGTYGWTMLATTGQLTCLQQGTIAVAASNVETIFEDGFEGAFPGAWSLRPDSGTQWGPSAQRVFAGGSSAYCAAGGSPSVPAGGPYPKNMNTSMVYGPFSLADAIAARATFAYWIDSETCCDRLRWSVSLNGVDFYGLSASGLSGGWLTRDFSFSDGGVPSMPSMLGQPQVWFAISFESDSSVQKEGAYVDSVRIEKTLPPPAAGCTVNCTVIAPSSVLVGIAAPFQATATPTDCTTAAAFSWSFGDGTAPTAVQNPSHTYSAAGWHLWQVTVSADGATCGKSGVIDAVMPPILPLRRHLRR